MTMIVPTGPNVTGMDIGTGASCIYPTIAASVYRWKMIASDIDPASVSSAREMVRANGQDGAIEVRLQNEKKPTAIFDGILKTNERIDFAMCNPPFYPSLEAFRAENLRKRKGLSKGGANNPNNNMAGVKIARRSGIGKEVGPPRQQQWQQNGKAVKGSLDIASSNNFGGTASELWCPGGEVSFVRNIIRESKRYWDRCLWFSSLVSRKTNLHKIERSLYEENHKNNKHNTVQIVERIPLGTGRKSSTILMWSFLDEEGRREWARMRKWGG